MLSILIDIKITIYKQKTLLNKRSAKKSLTQNEICQLSRVSNFFGILKFIPLLVPFCKSIDDLASTLIYYNQKI